jgi:hypothetical protein
MNQADSAKWCALCDDRAPALLLCAGCRVSICVSIPDYFDGCHVWDPIIDEDNFIYFCPYCLQKKKQPSLVSAERPSDVSN